MNYVLFRPLIGGTFADPATAFPEWFDTPFWRKYKYFLPSLIAAVLALVTVSIATFILEETLESKRATPPKQIIVEPAPTPASYGTTDSESSESEPQPSTKILTATELLSIPVMRAVCIASGALTFSASCFTHVLVLMSYTPIDQGGLAMSVSTPTLSHQT